MSFKENLWLGVIVLMMSCSPTQGQNTWLNLAPLSEARQEVGVAEVGGKLYVAGGFRLDQSTANTAEVYDPETDTWTTLAPMPIAVNHPAAVGVAGRLYVLGGYQSGLSEPTSAVQVYDPAQNLWSQVADMPTPRGGLAAAVIDDKIYAVGGARLNSVADFAVYDPTTDQWTELEPMPTPRDHLGAAAIDGKLYVVGGRAGGNFTLATLEVYDPVTSQWQELSPLPTGRSGHAVAALGNCLYAFGGEGNDQDAQGMFANVEKYNTLTGAWEMLGPMPTPRHGIGAAVIDAQIYLPAGATVAGFGAVATNEVLVEVSCE